MDLIAMKRKILPALIIASVIFVSGGNSTFALSLESKGLFQFQYENTSSSSDEQTVNELFIRRLKLTFLGQIDKNFKLVLEPEFGQGEPDIKDVYLMYQGGSFEILAGNHRVPFGGEIFVDDKKLMLIERSIMSRIAPDRNVGISGSWKTYGGQLIFQGGLWNSNFNENAETNLISDYLDDDKIFTTDFAERDSDKLMLIGTRFEYISKGYTKSTGPYYDTKGKKRMMFGLSHYMTASSPTEDGPLEGVTGLKSSNGAGADFFFALKNYNLALEIGNRTIDWWQYSFSLKEKRTVTSIQTAIAAQFLYFYSPEWAFTARVESLEYDSGNSILKGKYGNDSDMTTTGGVNYYLKKQNMKLQLNLINKEQKMPFGKDAIKSSTVLLQTTVGF